MSSKAEASRNPMSVEEVKELLTATLHGRLPEETVYRMMATLAEWMGLPEEIECLEKWIDDLQSGMYVNCVYCGHRYGPVENTPTSMRDILKEHVEQCPKHPLSKLNNSFRIMRSAIRFHCKQCDFFRLHGGRTPFTCEECNLGPYKDHINEE